MPSTPMVEVNCMERQKGEGMEAGAAVEDLREPSPQVLGPVIYRW